MQLNVFVPKLIHPNQQVAKVSSFGCSTLSLRYICVIFFCVYLLYKYTFFVYTFSENWNFNSIFFVTFLKKLRYFLDPFLILFFVIIFYIYIFLISHLDTCLFLFFIRDVPTGSDFENELRI